MPVETPKIMIITILKKGRPIYEKKGNELHQLAGVPEGPCSIPKLEKFQAALPGYQLKVLLVTPPRMLIYKGKTPSDKIIHLINGGDHYDQGFPQQTILLR